MKDQKAPPHALTQGHAGTSPQPDFPFERLIAFEGVVGGAQAGQESRSSDDGSSYAAHPKDLDVSHVTFLT